MRLRGQWGVVVQRQPTVIEEALERVALDPKQLTDQRHVARAQSRPESVLERDASWLGPIEADPIAVVDRRVNICRNGYNRACHHGRFIHIHALCNALLTVTREREIADQQSRGPLVPWPAIREAVLTFWANAMTFHRDRKALSCVSLTSRLWSPQCRSESRSCSPSVSRFVPWASVSVHR